MITEYLIDLRKLTSLRVPAQADHDAIIDALAALGHHDALALQTENER